MDANINDLVWQAFSALRRAALNFSAALDEHSVEDVEITDRMNGVYRLINAIGECLDAREVAIEIKPSVLDLAFCPGCHKNYTRDELDTMSNFRCICGWEIDYPVTPPRPLTIRELLALNKRGDNDA